MLQHPKTVVLKKTWILISAALLFVIIALILSNLYRATYKTQRSIATDKLLVTAHPTDIHWYQQQSVTALPLPKVIAPVIPVNLKPVSEFSADDLNAMAIPISTHQLKSNVSSITKATNNALKSNTDQNNQYEKQAFIKINAQTNSNNSLSTHMQNLENRFELQGGSIIPGIMLSGISSDLPGQIIAQVRSNVYDSPSGKYLLIPQGSRLAGVYDSQISYGQQRILIIWQRLIFPNGQSIALQGMPGTDLQGYAGFKGKINNHYMRLFGSTLLMSVIGIGGTALAPVSDNPFAPLTVKQALAQNLNINLASASSNIAEKNLNIQPTLTISPGYEFNIFVTRDMVFPKPYSF